MWHLAHWTRMHSLWQCLLEPCCRASRKVLGSVALGKPGCMLASMALGIHRANWELEAACTAAALVITSSFSLGSIIPGLTFSPRQCFQVSLPFCLSCLTLGNRSPQAYKWHHLSRLSSSFIMLPESCFDLLPFTTVAQNEVNFWNNLGRICWTSIHLIICPRLSASSVPGCSNEMGEKSVLEYGSTLANHWPAGLIAFNLLYFGIFSLMFCITIKT